MFWDVYLYVYDISLMTIPSYKSILISCGCFSKLNFIFLQWGSLIGPLQKTMIFWYSPNISIFHQYRTMVVLFKEILSHLIAWVQLLLLLLFLLVISDNNFYYWALGYIHLSLNTSLSPNIYGRSFSNFSILTDLKCFRSTFSSSTNHLWNAKPKELAKKSSKENMFFWIAKHGFFFHFFHFGPSYFISA